MPERPAYNVKRPCSPVPLARRAEVSREAANRWWELFTRYKGDDQFKWFDCDIALAESADLLGRLSVLAELVGDDQVLALIERAIAHASAADEAAA